MFTVETKIVLIQYRILEFRKNMSIFPNYFTKMINLFLTFFLNFFNTTLNLKNKLFRILFHFLSFFTSELINRFIPLPLSPYQITSIYLITCFKSPPRPILKYTLYKQSIIPLTNIRLIKHLLFRKDHKLIRQIYSKQKFFILKIVLILFEIHLVLRILYRIF